MVNKDVYISTDLHLNAQYFEVTTMQVFETVVRVIQ